MLITDPRSLTRACADAGAADFCAIDTEFVWRRTYGPVLALVQVAAPGGVEFVIDPLALDDLSPLGALLDNHDCVKVMHGSSQDLQLFAENTGTLPYPLYDSQIAAGFCGFGFQVGYESLLAKCVDIAVDKGEQTSNWLARPLSDAQQQYAVNEVTHLLTLYTALREHAERLDRGAWVDEECGLLVAKYRERQQAPPPPWERIRAYRHCSPQDQAILEALATWRDRIAQELDCPVGWIISDKTLSEIVKKKPADGDAILAIPGIGRRFKRRYVRDILATFKAKPNGHRPVKRLPRAVEQANKRFTKDVLGTVQKLADEMLMARELITTRDQVQQWFMALHDQRTPEMATWKVPLLKDLLSQAFGQATQEDNKPGA